jgi:hypothetical protein
MGYVIVLDLLTATFSPESLSPLRKMDFGGELELRPIGEALDDYRAFMEVLHARYGPVRLL